MILFLSLLSVLGLGISLYLLSNKVGKTKLVCFLGDDCEKVVKSKYGKTFGIPNEVPGVLFYLTVFMGAVLLYQGKETLLGLSSIVFLRVAATLAGLASLYLLYVQAFSLKMWCEYCIASALINGLILLILFT